MDCDAIRKYCLPTSCQTHSLATIWFRRLELQLSIQQWIEQHSIVLQLSCKDTFSNSLEPNLPVDTS